MSGLEDTFDGQVDFILLDWDDQSADAQREALNITARTQYVLVDPDGNVVQRWYGLLSESQVQADIEAAIAG